MLLEKSVIINRLWWFTLAQLGMLFGNLTMYIHVYSTRYIYSTPYVVCIFNSSFPHYLVTPVFSTTRSLT